ncbi:MAG: MBL fold metallo-hydrolase [Clostridia bacterium]|nr:MBL fold metallo-hydrolase [Clostridia bacterium]
MVYSFDKVTEGIYYLRTPYADQAVGVTLVKGERRENTVLIDAGARADTVTECIIPALKELNMSLRDVGTVTFTHFHTDNIRGLFALVNEAPGICVAVPRGTRERIQNPMYYIIKDREVFPMHNPGFEELSGVLVDREITDEGMLAGMKLISAPGHDDDCFCWFHLKSGTLISGDALQGNGNAHQGVPSYKSISDYLATLEKLRRLPVKHLVASRSMDGLRDVEHGEEGFPVRIARCEECVKDVGAMIGELMRNGLTDTAEIAKALSVGYFKAEPSALCYAMQTVSAHIREGVLGNCDE